MRRCCCQVCTYFHAVASSPAEGQATFEDALDNDLLEPITGTWSVGTGGRLRVTGPGKILIDVPQPDAVSRMRLQVGTSVAGGSGATINEDATLRFSVDYTDDSNRHYAEGHIRSSPSDPPETVGKIARVEGGSETVLWEDPINLWYNSGLSDYLTATLCIQDHGVRFSPSASDYGLDDPIAAPTTAVGGLYATIEVEQGESEVHEFDFVILRKVGYPLCPVHDCGSCFTVIGCHQHPAAGFLVGITGVADYTGGGSRQFSNVAANFNGSFVVDQIDEHFFGTLTFETEPCYSPSSGFVEHPQKYAWKSEIFELDPVVVYTESGTPLNYTHGRVILIPVDSGDECTPKFRLILQIAQSDNNLCLFWIWLADMQPTVVSGANVAGDCTALDGATFTENTATFPNEDVQEDMAFTVTAL